MPVKDYDLLTAIEEKDLAKFKELMDQKVKDEGIDALNKVLSSEGSYSGFNGCTPFVCAASFGSLEICQFLFDQGADPELPNPSNLKDINFYENTPLEVACYWAEWEGIKFLIENCNVTVSQDALLMALSSREGDDAERKKIIKYLLQHGTSLWGLSRENETYFENLVKKEYAVANLSMLDKIMTELGQPINYHRQVACRDTNDKIVYTLPVLANLFLSLKDFDQNKLNYIILVANQLLVVLKVDPTQPIKWGDYRGLSPLDILIGQIIAKKASPDIFNRILELLLIVTPSLIFYPIRLNSQDKILNSVMKYIGADEAYKKILVNAVARLTEAQISLHIQDDMIFKFMSSERRFAHVKQVDNNEDLELNLSIAVEEEKDAMLTEGRKRKPETELRTEEQQAKLKTDAELISMFGITAADTSNIPVIPVEVPAAALKGNIAIRPKK